MRDMGIVFGDEQQAVSLIVSKDTVYVHTEISEVPQDHDEGAVVYQYHEIQYGKDEYIQLMAARSESIENAVIELAQMTMGEESAADELSNLFARKVLKGELNSMEVPGQIRAQTDAIFQMEINQ